MPLHASRSARRLASQAISGCRHSQSTANSSSSTTLRPFLSGVPFSTSRSRPQEQAAAAPPPPQAPPSEPLPRWARTPERMKAPFSPHITKNPANSIWAVNEDPAKLDDALNNLLGKGGERLLPDELKWLAVTHKSFDQGRRGFNDRLAYLGRHIAILEAMQGILSEAPEAAAAGGVALMGEKDAFEARRKPFEDKALEVADRLSVSQPYDVFDLKKMQRLAVDTGISEVVRWKPRKPESLLASGIAPVMTGALFAIIGAISLQHGGKVASRVVRERILRKIKP